MDRSWKIVNIVRNFWTMQLNDLRLHKSGQTTSERINAESAARIKYFYKSKSWYSESGATEHWTFVFNVRLFVHVRRTFEHANMVLRKKLKNIRTFEHANIRILANMRTFELLNNRILANIRTIELSNNRTLANIRTLNIRKFEYYRTFEL